MTLTSDGLSVHDRTSADEVVDLLHDGQRVFGIELGREWRDVGGPGSAARRAGPKWDILNELPWAYLR